MPQVFDRRAAGRRLEMADQRSLNSTGAYDAMLIGIMVLMTIGALAVLTIGKPKSPDTSL